MYVKQVYIKNEGDDKKIYWNFLQVGFIIDENEEQTPCHHFRSHHARATT
jgi:hypothetical protein